MKEELVYLDTYLLQKDMRIRLPKCIIENLGACKGETRFSVYLDKSNRTLVLKPLTDERSRVG